MKTLYLDCSMGAAGDMLTAALLELLPEPDKFVERINALGIPGVQVKREKSVKCGITGTHMSVLVHGAEETVDSETPQNSSQDHDQEDSHDHTHEHPHDHTEDHVHPHDHSHTHDHTEDHVHTHEHTEDHDHSHSHDHSHPHDCADNCSHEAIHSHVHDNADDHPHTHSHAEEPDHSHDHTEDHVHTHEYTEDHVHNHSHDHSHPHSHHHSSMHEIEHILVDLKLPEQVAGDVLAVYGLIAGAESHVHGVPVTEIHFHEVGTLDAVADIVSVCLLMKELAPDEVVVSPVHVGSGHVKCAHGILPVPAPATAFILKDVPIYGGSVEGELCTPTGAALLKHFASRFGDMPVMKVQAMGYGMGKKDFDRVNCVRALLGETENQAAGQEDVVLELSCNVDDMTPEEIGFAMGQLFDGGAKEVYTVPIGMKKSRPGTLIRVMCKEQDREKMLSLIFKYTSTIGVRETLSRRYILDRKEETIQTPYGEVRRKLSSGYGVTRSKLEYEDLAQIARERGTSMEEVRSLLEEFIG